MEQPPDGNQFYIALLVFLIMGSAFFSACEMAFSCVNKIKLKSLAREGNTDAARVLKLTEAFDKLLSTVLIGNNVVNISSSAVATMLLLKYVGEQGAAMASAIMTVLILIFGEISPKIIAKRNPEKFAMTVVSLLQLLVTLCTPFTFLLGGIRVLLGKILGDAPQEAGMSDYELKVLVDEVANAGKFDKDESNLIKSAIEFDDIKVKEIYTPRVDLVSCSLESSNAEILRLFSSHGFSRLPVYDADEQEIIGIILAKDFYDAYLKDPKFSIAKILRSVPYVLASTKISTVLKNMQHNKEQLAVVVDSYGGVSGLVTIEDILEELVGEIWDEHDEPVSVFHKLGDNRYLISCSSAGRTANVRDMFEYMGIDFDLLNIENVPVSQWVADTLGYIPTKGDGFIFRNVDVVVNKTNRHRLLEIIVTVHREEVDPPGT